MLIGSQMTIELLLCTIAQTASLTKKHSGHDNVPIELEAVSAGLVSTRGPRSGSLPSLDQNIVPQSSQVQFDIVEEHLSIASGQAGPTTQSSWQVVVRTSGIPGAPQLPARCSSRAAGGRHCHPLWSFASSLLCSHGCSLPLWPLSTRFMCEGEVLYLRLETLQFPCWSV